MNRGTTLLTDSRLRFCGNRAFRAPVSRSCLRNVQPTDPATEFTAPAPK